MRYVVFEKSAVEHFINSRYFQTTEYEEGENLAKFLHGETKEIAPMESIYFKQDDDGCFFVGSEMSKTFIVIDLINSKLLDNVSVEETVLVIQKLFRFSVKYWNNLGFTTSELILTDTNKAVVFPFPFSKRSTFRVVIEREPDSVRLAKRGLKQTLLVYKSGYDGTPSQVETPTLSIFRQAIETVQSALTEARRYFEVSTVKKELQRNLDGSTVMSFSEAQGVANNSTLYMSYPEWDKVLTKKQREFIEREINGQPMRLEGPAGTGKTISLILKAYLMLENAEMNKKDCRIIFFAHSKATQISIRNVFQTVSMGKWGGSDHGRAQSIHITTLHEYCVDSLIENITENEILERDALSSKELQYYAVTEAYNTIMEQRYKTYKPILSTELQGVLESEDKGVVCSLLQHEFSVMIKGKASGDPEKYKRIPALSAGIRALTENDKGFIYQIYQEYQKHFEISSQYDTDDIILTAIGRLDSPIWRRRRKNDGFDYVFIDETHLFNQNETMVFHHLTKDSGQQPFVFSIDVSQSIGDQGDVEISFTDSYNKTNDVYKKEYDLVFRCSPQITDLAMSITASGANLFGHFRNPYKNAISAFTAREEAISKLPEYQLKINDSEMINAAVQMAENMATSMKCSPGEIAIISFSETLHREMQHAMGNKSFEVIEQRGDIETKDRAKEGMSYILTLPEYVGGLEFYGVILVGVDGARVPPVTVDDISKNYLRFAFYNKLYVSVTRAKYQVNILGSIENGDSICLENSLSRGTLARA